MRRLVALDLPAGPDFVTALRRAWDDGDAVLPVDQRLPAPAKARLITGLDPARVIERNGFHDRPGARPVEPGDALVMPTSGTTGDPKGAVLTHDALAASARVTSRRLGVGPDDEWLACLPLSHVGGLSVVTRALITGCRLTVLPGFDADAVSGAARNGATLVSLVAAVLDRIDPSLFRVIVLGGARPPSSPPANAVTTYGMTETGSGVVYDGVPLDGVEVEIAPDSGIRLRGPMLLRAYRDGGVPLDADGWFDTGDLGGWEEDGRLRVAGRRGDLIVTGGENVWPGPVEDVLRGSPDVRDVVVLGEDHPRWGQQVVAVIVPRPGASLALGEIRDRVKEQLPAFCVPGRLVVVDAIERTALGKPVRPALRRLLERTSAGAPDRSA